MRPLSLALFTLPLAGCYWMIWDPERDDDLDSGAYAASCEPGQIRRVATGERFESLDAALDEAWADDAFCIGAGTYPVSGAAWGCQACGEEQRVLSIVGAGSDETVLTSATGEAGWDDAPVTLGQGGPAERITLEGLRFHGLAVWLVAGEAELSDLAFTADVASRTLLQADTVTLTASGLSFSDIDHRGTGVLRLAGTSTIDGLTVRDNMIAPGSLLAAVGDLVLTDPLIESNNASSDEIGAFAVEVTGDLTVRGGQLRSNAVGGPLVQAWRGLILEDVEIMDNAGLMQGQIVVADSALVTGGSMSLNRSLSAAFELAEEASLQLEGVDFGLDKQANRPCDVSMWYLGDMEPQCIGASLGPDTTVLCDLQGCR